MSQFAPTPMHGAAYAIAIDAVGGIYAIGGCDTQEKLAVHRARLEGIREWAKTQEPTVRRAYVWGTDKVEADLRARLEVHENSRAVTVALQSMPRPSNPEE